MVEWATTELTAGMTGTEITPGGYLALTLYWDEETQAKKGRHSHTEENTKPNEFKEKELIMPSSSGRMLMRILLVLGGEGAGNRTQEIDNVAGS